MNRSHTLVVLTMLASCPLMAQDAELPPEATAAAPLEESLLPSLPTAEELQALSAEEFAARATAMKQVLLLQNLQFIADSYRMTEGNHLASAALAAKLGAPEVFVQLLMVSAAGSDLSAREHRALNKAYAALYELYRVDPLAVRLFAESELLPLDAMADMAPELPLASLFNTVDEARQTPQKLTSDLVTVATVYEELTALYAGVSNAEQAEAVVPQVKELVSRFSLAYPGLIFAPQEIQQLLGPLYSQKVLPLIPALKAQRERMREENYYGNAHLTVLDFFLD